MANAMKPTYANIISSLGIRGATVSENLPGYIPVLDETGRLNANFIPVNAEQVAIPSISDVAYVDPYTTVGFDTEGNDIDTGHTIRKGSISAPFKSLAEAATYFSPTASAIAGKYMAFMLAPGKYDDAQMYFPSSRMPLSVYILGLGECRFSTSLIIQNMASAVSGRNPAVFIQSIYTESSASVSVSAVANVTVIGKSYISTLNASSGSSLLLASDSRVDSTNISSISYISEARRVGYVRRGDSGASFPEGTVAKELDRLRRRRVRIVNVSMGSTGLVVGSSSYADIMAGSSSGADVFDMRAHDRILINGLNTLFSRGKDIVADTVNAGTIVADNIQATNLRMDALSLGGYKLAIDTYGYLVVLDGSGTTPIRPPDTVFLIRDSVTGELWTLGISNGRLYIVGYEGSSYSSDSSSSSGIHDSIQLHDTGNSHDYIVTVSDGEIYLTQTT